MSETKCVNCGTDVTWSTVGKFEADEEERYHGHARCIEVLRAQLTAAESARAAAFRAVNPVFAWAVGACLALRHARNFGGDSGVTEILASTPPAILAAAKETKR